MILGASRWLELKAPTAARRPAAIAAVKARIRTAGLRIAQLLGGGSGSSSPCAGALLADLKLPARDSQQRRAGAPGRPWSEVLEQREDRLHHLRLVRVRDLLERLGVGHRQVGAGHA